MPHAEVYTSEMALEIGFLDRIVPKERLLDEAKAEARQLGTLHADVYAEAKRRLRSEGAERAFAKWKEESGGRRGLLAGRA